MSVLECVTRGCYKDIRKVSRWYKYTYGRYYNAECDHCGMLYWVFKRKGQRLKKKDRIKGIGFEERMR